ncbi:MAG: hypothetical protein J6A29_04800 [Clostridia bacterium]|nr:hypothetical protein [Clostridia bacterium]
MKNNKLYTVSIVLGITSLLALLFLGGAWYGSAHLSVAWGSVFKTALFLILASYTVWLCGRHSRSTTKKREDKTSSQH